MAVTTKERGNEIYHDGSVWRLSSTGEPLHDAINSGGGQELRCVACEKMPTPEGHDACLGNLPENLVKNACCGHNDPEYAYIQYWDGTDIRGEEAIKEQQRLIKERDNG